MTDIQAKEPMATLVALDLGFACLLENIKNIDPTLAQSLAIDLQQTAKKIPLHLPPPVHSASEILNHWAAVLNSQPTQQDAGQSN